MATPENIKNKKGHHEKLLPEQGDNHLLREQLGRYEKEKNILLTLSSDITKVREKNDLVKILSSTLKEFFQFSHVIIGLVDWKKNIFFPFLKDPQANPVKDPELFNALFDTKFSLTDSAFTKLIKSDEQSSLLIEEIMDKPGVPGFFKINYDLGMREGLLTPLRGKMETFGFIFIYSATTDSFSDLFRSVVRGIAPHLSNAVANIIINEDIRQKEYVTVTLLSLSNDMVTVRNRTDLLNVINFGLKKLIYFTHSVMTVLNENGQSYHAYLIDPDSRAKVFPEYAEMVTLPNPVADGIYDVASLSNKPVVFNMDSFDLSKAPVWFRLNYAAGARELMIKILPGAGVLKHSIILFSDRLNSFDDQSIRIIERISSQLSTAASNISANEEIVNREKDKSFLLEFSHDIASARTRNDLSLAIHRSLKKLSDVKAYFIRTINEDGETLSPFTHDDDVFYRNDPEFNKLLNTKIPVDTGITGKVMRGNIPVMIDFMEEIDQGNSDHYIEFWKKLGPQKKAFQKMIGTPLQVGDMKLGVLWVITNRINMNILDGICAQISVAISDIRSNEEILNKEKEKSFLLDFSQDIAAVRSKEDLAIAVQRAVKKISSVKGYVIRLINDDGATMSAYIFDSTIPFKNDPEFLFIRNSRLPIKDGFQDKILASDEPIFFNIEEESKNVHAPQYIHFWKKVEFLRMTGTALRTGNKELGVFWMETDKVNIPLLKGICAQLSVAISNIMVNEQLTAYKQMLEVENDHLREQIQTIYNFSDIIGSGAEMQNVYHMMSLVAESNSTVLLLGETGTGKELIARAIHNASPRKDKLMIKVNCAALPANLIESELFGHEKGSFTGAIDRRIGKFELANNSTLFLDEIGEMPLETQVKLLRVIQERELERVGGKATIKVNVRIIAATNRNLEDEVKAGRFRSDLYYRLNVFPIILPPLRNRPEDIEPLANFFLARYSRMTGRKVTSVSNKVMQELKSYLWPGNVRELEHLIERSILLSAGNILKEIQLPKNRDEEENDRLNISNKTLQQLERTYIIEILKRCSGKIAGKGSASELLEIPPTTLHSKLKKLAISKADYFPPKH